MPASLRRIDTGLAERVFYPVSPVLVTAVYRDRVGGMLAAWWTQLSFNPMLYGVAIAPERYTYKLVIASGKFAISILPFSMVDKAGYLGDVSERFHTGKIEAAGIEMFEGEALGVPIPSVAIAAAELRLIDVVKTGDHDLFIGKVEAAYASDGFNGLWDEKGLRPLMYLGRTRRPGPVYRVYLTPTSWEVRRVEYAAGDLSRYAVARREVLNRVREAVRRARSWNEAEKAVVRILAEAGVDVEDAVYYVAEVMG